MKDGGSERIKSPSGKSHERKITVSDFSYTIFWIYFLSFKLPFFRMFILALNRDIDFAGEDTNKWIEVWRVKLRHGFAECRYKINSLWIMLEFGKKTVKFALIGCYKIYQWYFKIQMSCFTELFAYEISSITQSNSPISICMFNVDNLYSRAIRNYLYVNRIDTQEKSVWRLFLSSNTIFAKRK